VVKHNIGMVMAILINTLLDKSVGSTKPNQPELSYPETDWHFGSDYELREDDSVYMVAETMRHHLACWQVG